MKKTDTIQALKQQFENPPREYSAMPFWFLNDDLQDDSLRSQLREMVEKGIYAVIPHPRKGMTVPYLSETWFQKIGVILEEAKRLGMEVFLYDECDWPSGYAGGKVIAENEDYAAQCLSVEKIIPALGSKIHVQDVPGKQLEAVIASWSNKEFYDITKQLDTWEAKTLCLEVFVFRSEKCGHSPAYSEEPYVNLLNRQAVATFIQKTHAEYQRRFPAHWGTTIKGFFTDEPAFFQNCVYETKNLNTIPWCGELPAFFEEVCGYSLLPYLGALWDDMGDLSRKVRQDFYRVFTKLYNESYFRQIHDFLDPDGLLSIGHLAVEEHLQDAVQSEGHFFTDMQYFHIPGIDRIDRERPRITEKLGSSAMHIYERERCLCEDYGCFGWGLTLQEMKAEADFLMVQGVNLLVPHAFFSSIEGFRKTESPPSLFYQNPYWPHFKIFADYIRRMSFALTTGTYAADLLVYYPITSCYEQFQPLEHYGVNHLDKQLIRLCDGLQTAQLDFDFVDDRALENCENQMGGCLKVGATAYRCVILPPVVNLPEKTLQVLTDFVKRGGTVIATGHFPVRADYPEADSRAAALCEDLTALPGFVTATPETVSEACRTCGMQKLRLVSPDQNIRYMHRVLEDGELWFLVNEAPNRVEHVVTLPSKGLVQRMDLQTGQVEPISALQTEAGTVVPLELEAYGSALLLVEKAPQETQLKMWRVTLPDGSKIETDLGDWAQLGIPDYSGSLTYETAFFAAEPRPMTLELSEVYDVAQAELNGKLLPARCWQPYRWEIGQYLHQGENQLRITVKNTMGNALTEEKAPSGLYGPVILR